MNATLILLGVDPGSFTPQLLAAVAQAVQQQLSFPDPVVNGTSWAPAILVSPAMLPTGPSQLCPVSSSGCAPQCPFPRLCSRVVRHCRHRHPCPCSNPYACLLGFGPVGHSQPPC